MISASTAARALGVSRQAIRNRQRRGSLPVRRGEGRSAYVPLQAILDELEARQAAQNGSGGTDA